MSGILFAGLGSIIETVSNNDDVISLTPISTTYVRVCGIMENIPSLYDAESLATSPSTMSFTE